MLQVAWRARSSEGNFDSVGNFMTIGPLFTDMRRDLERKLISCMAALVLLIASARSFAYQDPWRADAKMLPQYCQDRVDWTKPNSPWEKWRSYFGAVAIHMSHYCAGVHAELMAKREFDQRKRSKWVAAAAQEMAYVSPYCDPKCVIYVDLHKRWAWALREQGNFAEAMKHTQLANSAASIPRPAPSPSMPR